MYHCEVTSIYRKWDFPPPPPPRKFIGPAEIPESTQARILLPPQTPSCLLLLSKQRDGLVVRGGYEG